MATPRRSRRPVILRRLLEPHRDHASVLAQAYGRLFQTAPASLLDTSCTSQCYHDDLPSATVPPLSASLTPLATAQT